MSEISKEKPVLVTGATGYVAGWIVKKLLDEGITVHAAVRDPKNEEKLKYLNNIAKNSVGKIKYFESDLLESGSYDEAMKDCELVFHTASPFTLNVKDAQKDLVEPALKGTQNVLESVNKTESVKRVVLTSSCVAIVGDAIECESYPNGTATEEHWNTTSSVDHQPYNYSKTLAEKEAWRLSEEQDRWSLVVVNPSFVLGPGINPKGTSETFTIIKQMGDGTNKAGAPDFSIGVVDVRDLAEAHFNAGYSPEANGRNIVSAENTDFLSLAEMLREKFGDAYPFPKKKLPKFLIWLIAPKAGMTRKMVSLNIGHKWKVDNSKSKRELNVKYRPVKESVVDLFQQMIDEKVL